MDSLISIVIPVHNREDLLMATLDSVLSQTYENWECIIVDDHSTDSSFSIAKKFEEKDSRFRVVSLPNSKRYGNAARNYGFRLANGNYINFLDSDDLFSSKKLEKQILQFDSHPVADAIICEHALFSTDIVSTHRKKISPKEFWLDILFFPNVSNQGGLWHTGSPLWKREAINKIGGWNEDVLAYQDVEFNFRAIIAGLEIVILDEVLLLYRTGSYSKLTNSHNFLKYQMQCIVLIWKMFVKENLVSDLRKRTVALRLYYISSRYIANGEFRQGLLSWFLMCIRTRQPAIRIMIGLVSLCMGPFRSLNTLRRLLYSKLMFILEGA